MEGERRGTERGAERSEGSMEGSGEWRWAETPTIVGGTMNESSTRFEARGTSADIGASRASQGTRGTTSSGARTSDTAETLGEGISRTTPEGAPRPSARGESRTSDMGVDCPGCRERVTGRSEGEVSTNLREHMETSHSREPYMTRLMEKMKGR